MKRIRLLVLVALCQFLRVPGAESNPQRTSIEPANLGQYLFIGQAYPSGNVYLKPFSGDSKIKSFWPEGLSLIALGGVRPDLLSVRRATFNRGLASRTENDVVKSVYIPGAEGMDESHASCGLGEIGRENPKYESLSDDFFRTVFDHCEPNDGIGLFRTAPSNYSVMVIGVADSAGLASHRVVSGKRLRPLTASEKANVDREKAEAAKSAAQSECSTNPSYLDAAVQVFEGSLKEVNLTLRVSAYDNPGCAGHLASIYILDVLRNGEPIQKFEISQYQGAY